MSGTKTLLWAVVLLMVAAVYYVYDIQGGKTRRDVARQRQFLVHIAAPEVTGCTIIRADSTIAAEKRQNHWYLTTPFTAPGDDQTYADLVRSMAELRFLRRIEAAPASLEPFGLTSPGLEIHLQLEPQTPPLRLRFGNQNPTGSGYYAQVEGDTEVYLVGTAVVDALDASLYDLRDKTVLAFEPAEVQEVRIDSASTAPVVLQRRDGGPWQMTAPVHASGDAEQVRALLRGLRDVQVQAFVAEAPTDLQPYGLAPPALHLTLGSGGDRSVQTLLFGTSDPDAQGVFSKRSNTANVFLVPRLFWDNLPRTAAALRDKTLLQYDRERIARIDMRTPEGQTVIVRTGERQYRLEQPVGADADRNAIDDLLTDLKALKATDFVAETPDALTPYGLDTPRLQVTISEDPGDHDQETIRHTLLFGNKAPEPSGVYVRLAAQPTVYVVDSSAAQRLMEITAFDLRNKKILAFAPSAIDKIRLQYPQSTLTLERHGDAWEVSAPERQTIRQSWQVGNLLYELSTLEYARLLVEPATAEARYGLQTPEAEITLWRQDGTAIGPLIIGGATDAAEAPTPLRYARVGSGAPLYAIKADVLDSLPRAAADLTAQQ